MSNTIKDKRFAKKYDLDGDWDEYLITCVNPTPNDVLFNLLDPLVVQQTNVPNTPSGYVQPPILQGSPTFTPSPACTGLPDTLNTFNYAFPIPAAENNTLAYDSSTGKLFISAVNTLSFPPDFTLVSFKTTTQNFFVSNLTVPLLNPFDYIISMVVSTTSGRLAVLTTKGLLTIIETSSFTILSTITLSTAALNSVHTQVAWNSINNRFYITSYETGIQESVVVVDAVFQTELFTISTPTGSFPSGIAFNVNNNVMLVTYLSNSVAYLDCNTNTLTTIILNTITTQPNRIFYNPNNNLVTYGSSGTLGIRSFDYTTLAFSPVVFNAQLKDATLHPLNTIYFLIRDNIGNYAITQLDADTLFTLNTYPIANTEINVLNIEYFPPANEVYANNGISLTGKDGSYYYLTSSCNPVFYITGSAEYNDSVRDFFNSPAWTTRIYVYAKNKKNLNQVIQHIYKDANGTECNIPRIPVLSIGVNQFQDWIAQLDFPNNSAVFGINQFFQNVLIEKYSEISFLLIYKQIEKVKLLTIGSQMGAETLCDEVASCKNGVRKWSEKDLEINDYNTITPFKQNLFAGLKEDAVKPFDFSMLHTYQIESNCIDKCGDV